MSSLRYSDLLLNTSLRALEVAARRIRRPIWITPQVVESASHFLKHVLSIVASPAYAEVIIVYRNYDFFGVRSAYGVRNIPPFRSLTEATNSRVEETPSFLRVSEPFREVHEV